MRFTASFPITNTSDIHRTCQPSMRINQVANQLSLVKVPNAFQRARLFSRRLGETSLKGCETLSARKDWFRVNGRWLAGWKARWKEEGGGGEVDAFVKASFAETPSASCSGILRRNPITRSLSGDIIERKGGHAREFTLPRKECRETSAGLLDPVRDPVSGWFKRA